MKITRLLVVLGWFLSLFCNSSFAYEPFLTDDASTVAKGKNQIEFYYYNIFNKSALNPDSASKSLNSVVDINIPGEEFIGADRAIGFPAVYTRGISEHLEASMGMTYYGFPRGNYTPFTNHNIGFKYRFWGNAESGYSFAFKPALTLPSQTEHQAAGLGMALTGYGLNFIGTFDQADYSLLFNFAYQHQPYNTNYSVSGSFDPIKTNLYQLSFAPIWNVSRQLHAGLDLGLITNVVVADDQKFNYFAMVAITYQPIDDLDLGVSYLRVAPNFRDEFSAGYSSIFKVGLTYRF